MNAVRLDEDRTAPIDLRPRTRRAIREEAALRRMSPEGFVSRVLDAIEAGDLWSVVLSTEKGAA